MAGQIIKRGENKFLVRVFLGRDAQTGKRNYLNKTIRGTKKDAQKWLNATLREIHLGVFVEPASESVNTFLDKWLEAAAKPRLRQRTYEDYQALLRRYVRDELGKLKLSTLRPLDIQRLYSKMQAQGLSARVIRYTHAVLSSALKQAVQWGLLSRNPAQLVQLPKQTKTEMQALSAEQVARFLAACTGDRYATLFAFAITTGLRPEEYFALQWKDINLEQGTVMVQRAMVRNCGGGWSLEEPKTSRSRRTLPLPASMIRAMVEHRHAQLEERLRAGSEYQSHDFVFATETGLPLMIQNLTRRHFKPALKRAGLSPSIRLYDLRHTCATLLLSAGENAKVVSERLGHASITLTLDTYAHVLPDMQKAAADRLERLIFASSGTL
jgi:integrase